MREKHLHVADEQLLLHARGELRASSSGQVQAHLDSCQECRARLAELENTLVEFGEARKVWAAEVPPKAMPRAVLEARLGGTGGTRSAEGWVRSAWSGAMEHGQTVAFATVAIAILLLAARWLRGPAESVEMATASAGHWEEPDLRLTPGATVPVTEGEICGAAEERAVPVVPVSVRRKVFEDVWSDAAASRCI